MTKDWKPYEHLHPREQFLKTCPENAHLTSAIKCKQASVMQFLANCVGISSLCVRRLMPTHVTRGEKNKVSSYKHKSLLLRANKCNRETLQV